MEASGLSASEFDNEEKVLKSLLDAFGSAFSLDEIASAYCKADRNPDLVYEFLYETKGSTSSSSIDAAANGEAKGSEQSSSDSLCVNVSEQSFEGNGNSRPSNAKNRSVSIGIVSSIIGKDYIRTTRSRNATKPMKQDSKVLPVSDLLEEEVKSSSEKDNSLHSDMEDFLFRMLGHGFKLERDVIGQVLDACGYDMPKSMQKLLDLSTATLDGKNKSVSGSTDEFMGLHSKAEAPSYQRKGTNNSVSTEDTTSNSSKELSTGHKQRNDLGRDILTSLFCAPEKRNDFVLPKVKVTAAKRSGIFGEAVAEPPFDCVAERNATAVYPQKHDEYEKDDETYLALRKGVKEYRTLMMEYYKSAVEAFVKGDRTRAGKLLEQGDFFFQKADEADEESSKMILETKEVEEQEEMLLDLHNHGAKEAVRLLKRHLSSLSGIPSIQYLKVIIDTNDEESAKGSRRRSVLKLLEKEAIKWVEGENGGTIRIQLDSINRQRLSFVRK